MAITYVWPIGLPQMPQPSYSETGGVLILRTPMDAGPAKMRRRGIRPAVLTLTYDMTTAQVLILETFVQDTLRGTSRFGLPHPRLETQVEARIVPSSEGQLYATKYVSPNWWEVSLSAEVLP